MGLPEIIILIIIIYVLVLIATLRNILNNEGLGNNKLTWVILVIFLPVIGSAMYYLSVKKKNKSL